MLLLGARLQTALATWASRNSGDLPALWTGEDARGYATGYIALAPTVSNVVTNHTWAAVACASSVRLLFAPDPATTLTYTAYIGQTPLPVSVDAGDDAPAAQARVAEAWAAGLWRLDGWTLTDIGGGVWEISPPATVGVMPAVALGYGWTLDSSVSLGTRDVSLVTTAVGVRLVYWMPVRSRLLAAAHAARLMSLVRSDSDNADRGAELGLSWAARPALAEPLPTLEVQPDLGGLVDAAAIELTLYARTLSVAGGEGLAGGSLQIATLPAVPLPEIVLP